MEMHRVWDDALLFDAASVSSCAHGGKRRGNHAGMKLRTTHDKRFCHTAMRTVGFWPKINLGLDGGMNMSVSVN